LPKDKKKMTIPRIFFDRNVALLAEPLRERVLQEASGSFFGHRFVCRQQGGERVVLEWVGDRTVPLPGGFQSALGERQLAEIPAAQGLVLAGIRSRACLEQVLKHQAPLSLGMKQPILVVEPDLSVFVLMLHLYEMSAYLGADNFLWFVGEDWKDQLLRFFDDRPMMVLPEKVIAAGGKDGVQEALSSLRSRQAFQVRETLARSRAYYAQKEECGTGGPWAEDVPVRVLLITSRFTTVLQYQVRDLAEGFRRLGCPVEVLIERSSVERMTARGLTGCIARFRPDLVVQLDHLRTEWQGLIDPRVRFVCWIQDRLPHLTRRDLIEALSDRDVTFCSWHAMKRECEALGYPDVELLYTAADDGVYRPSEWKRPEYVCDVAFVSNVEPVGDHRRYPGLVRRGVEILRKEGIGYRDPAFYSALLHRLERETGVSVAPEDRGMLEHYLSFTVERYVQRTLPIQWAQEMKVSIKLFGSGWDKIPAFRHLACGPVAPGEDLCALYRSAKIHLHANSDHNVHQRVFECLASGGMILAWAHPTDERPGGLGEVLEIGREVMTYDGKEDFQSKLRTYLENPRAREEAVRVGQARVLREHTFRHRAEQILETVRRRAGRACGSRVPSSPAMV
jgi:hypothetical protein